MYFCDNHQLLGNASSTIRIWVQAFHGAGRAGFFLSPYSPHSLDIQILEMYNLYVSYYLYASRKVIHGTSSSQ